MSASASDGARRLEDVLAYRADPLGFVQTQFPWGRAQSALAQYEGPRVWQAAFLADIGQAVGERAFDGVTPAAPIQMATASGHGIGKSALTAWLILWLMSTRPHCKGAVTANTSEQLKTKTWAELAKWRRLCATGTAFGYTASRGNLAIFAKHAPETWRFDALTCRVENSEAFAGLHAAHSSPVYIFDEASAVPDAIWEVAEGGLTDGEPFWLVFGNPTRNTGRFRECFGRLRHRWQARQIDSRSVEGTNKQLFAQWIEDYGEDSDFVRVRVRGAFPRASSLQFVASDIVAIARRTVPAPVVGDPLVLGVDVARFGDDQSVIAVRRGRDARTAGWVRLREVDTMGLVGRVAEMIRDLRPDAVFVDAGGVGGGVVDRLRQLRHPVTGIQFGAKADRGALNAVDAAGERYANKRAEMWGAMRAWLRAGGAIPDDDALEADLTGVEYGYDGADRIQLEKKEDMKKRGLASPDLADALALTFAYPVGVRPLDRDAANDRGPAARSDYDPFEGL